MPEFLAESFQVVHAQFLTDFFVSYILTKVACTVYAGGVVFKEVFG
jgi:SSS family solute:Na+ symporter